MGVLQDLRDGLRAFVYNWAKDFVKAEDGRHAAAKRARREVNFKAFYNVRELDDKGYSGHDDFDARLLFGLYEKYGEKGLALVGFYDGVKLNSREMINVQKLAEHCDLIENGSSPDAGINLALRMVDKFSLERILGLLEEIKDPYISLTLGLQNALEINGSDINPEGADRGYDLDDFSEEALADTHNEARNRHEQKEGFSDVDKLISSAFLRSKETESHQATLVEKDLGRG